ncbi:uncharacterized protein LOC123441583 [Hordeum vulgare subsp. vulgare]|uniref:uncharacterized protein LOC123441583 n=1 Tax=Hordeum vulgare subsp. vulgare TaxID=112509 RepID=UPI001D1A4E7A|nr:uncharacterized protein LOC123441583 [Hordeum vulgare subsp. vulgare]
MNVASDLAVETVLDTALEVCPIPQSGRRQLQLPPQDPPCLDPPPQLHSTSQRGLVRSSNPGRVWLDRANGRPPRCSDQHPRKAERLVPLFSSLDPGWIGVASASATTRNNHGIHELHVCPNGLEQPSSLPKAPPHLAPDRLCTPPTHPRHIRWSCPVGPPSHGVAVDCACFLCNEQEPLCQRASLQTSIAWGLPCSWASLASRTSSALAEVGPAPASGGLASPIEPAHGHLGELQPHLCFIAPEAQKNYIAPLVSANISFFRVRRFYLLLGISKRCIF